MKIIGVENDGLADLAPKGARSPLSNPVNRTIWRECVFSSMIRPHYRARERNRAGQRLTVSRRACYTERKTAELAARNFPGQELNSRKFNVQASGRRINETNGKFEMDSGKIVIGELLLGRVGSRKPPPTQVPTIEEKVEGMQRIDGFFPLYWDDKTGHLWMEIARFDHEILHLQGIAAGLGSNDIGIDRGARRGSRIVTFQRIGPKILMVEPNYRFRASSSNLDEIRAVHDAFAVSTHWSFPVAAETEERVLVDLNDFLLRDSVDLAASLRPGSYRLDKSRSAVYLPMTRGFPENTEIEVSLTFVREGRGPGRGDGFRSRGHFEGVDAVAADAAAATLRLHHSWVKLPEVGYQPRPADPRAGYFGVSYVDYSAPLGEPIGKRFIARHRLRKVDRTLP